MAVAAAVAGLLTAACVRIPPPSSGPGDGSGEGSGGGASGAGGGETASAPLPPPAPDAEAELARLREAGPTYTPYDRGPRVLWNVESERLLTSRLLPVLKEEDLPARTRALFWVLVGPGGRAADAVIQTSSGNDAFDAAAREVAAGLRFFPATAGGRAVPVWVVREISLLMK